VDRNFFLGKENRSKLVVGEQEKQVDWRKDGKARWAKERGSNGRAHEGRSKKGG